MLQQQAGAAGMIYIDMYRASLGRDACASSSWHWVEPFVPATPAAPVRPNARGRQGMADVLAQAVNTVPAAG